jgi:hypothetical protein
MSVASNMISLLAYGKHIALNYGNAAGVFWEDEAQALNLYGARIPVEKFKAMVGKDGRPGRPIGAGSQRADRRHHVP